MTSLLISTIAAGLIAGILRQGPAAFDQIVRTLIIWQRRNDLASLGDATFAPPDNTDVDRSANSASAHRTNDGDSPPTDFHTEEMHRASDFGGQP